MTRASRAAGFHRPAGTGRKVDAFVAATSEGSTLSTPAHTASAHQPVFSLPVCPIITDGTHLTPRYTDEGAVFLSAQNVKPFRFMPKKHRKVSVEDFRNYTARNKPQRGDVLLTRVGAGIGEAAVVDQDIEFAIYVSLALIRTDDTRLSPEFLVHWLNSPAGRASSHRETLGRGTSQGNLNLKLLRGVVLPLPPLHVQRRIVSELDALQAEVDELKRLLLPAILDRAFKGEL
jgi:type I restriction enzyme, S subunit